MSSPTYSSNLKPDPWLRIAVLISGQLLAATALILILLLPLDAFIRGAACAACCTFSRIELKRLRQGFDSCVEIRLFAGGEALIRDHGRQWQPATLLTGSIVLRRVGWLRLRTADGCLISELLRGDARESQQWRRLQLIWRHIGAA